MQTMKSFFYSCKLDEEKVMLIKTANLVLKDELNKQYTIGFFDGSIVQYEKEPQIPEDLHIADSVRFINELSPEVAKELISHLDPTKRAVYDNGQVKVIYHFADNSSYQ